MRKVLLVDSSIARVDVVTYLIEVDVLVLETREEVVDVVLAIDEDDADDDESVDEGPSGNGRFIEICAMLRGVGKGRWWKRDEYRKT